MCSAIFRVPTSLPKPFEEYTMYDSFAHFLRRLLPVLLFSLCCPALAAASPEGQIRQRFKDYLNIDVNQDAVTKTPYSGLYEVRFNDHVVYTDKDARYLFIGQVLNLETKEDYTQKALKKISTVDFAELPKDLAIKVVKGNGERTIAVFSDPNCRYCKQFEYNLQNVDNVIVYVYPFNILSEDSVALSKNVWCSPDPAQAWQDWMVKDKAPAQASTACVFPNEKIRALGEKLNIRGTPTIFFTDGTRLPGAVDAEALNKKLESLR